MRKLAIFFALLAILAAGCGDDGEESTDATSTTAAGDADGDDDTTGVTLPPGGTRLTAELSGPEEVPDPGDPDGSGTAIVTLNEETRQVCFDVTVTGIDVPTGMHVHEGPPGEAGPIAIPLVHPPSGDEQVIDCVDEVDLAIIRAVSSSPADYYLNVHTGPYPAGALRGQLAAG
jgi:hypothetical protein